MYRIVEVSNNILFGKETINEDEYNDIKISCNILNEIEKDSDITKELIAEYHELMEITKIQNISDHNIKRKIRNYLTLYKTFIDVWETKAKRKYDTDFLEYYKSLISKLYDTTFEYRFIYNLRNFIQHVDAPATKFSKSLDSPLRVMMSKEYFLKKHSGMQKRFSEELKTNQINEFDIIKCIEIVHQNLLDIHKKNITYILKHDMRYLLHSFKIMSLVNKYSESNGLLRC